MLGFVQPTSSATTQRCPKERCIGREYHRTRARRDLSALGLPGEGCEAAPVNQAPSKTTFSFQMRVLLCERCGAPIDVALAGGVTPCKYCGAQLMIAGRDERAIFQPGASPAPLPEPERLNRLRQQDNQPLLPPASASQPMLSLQPKQGRRLRPF